MWEAVQFGFKKVENLGSFRHSTLKHLSICLVCRTDVILQIRSNPLQRLPVDRGFHCTLSTDHLLRSVQNVAGVRSVDNQSIWRGL